MGTYTQPLTYEATEHFVGGRERQTVVTINGEPVEVCELVGARRMFRITQGFVYNDKRTGIEVAIPPGFMTDLGSIPAFARWLVSPDAEYAQAFVVHDRLYGLLREGKGLCDRAAADLMLWDALGIPYRIYRNGQMRRAICPDLTRSLIYRAVRIGGASRAA